MRLEDYADALGVQLRWDYLHNAQHALRYYVVSLDRCEVINGDMLKSPSGKGTTPEAAMLAYCRHLRGQRVTFEGPSSGRREYTVPNSLGVEYEGLR